MGLDPKVPGSASSGQVSDIWGAFNVRLPNIVGNDVALATNPHLAGKNKMFRLSTHLGRHRCV
jgi:hypothetical protein